MKAAFKGQKDMSSDSSTSLCAAWRGCSMVFRMKLSP